MFSGTFASLKSGNFFPVTIAQIGEKKTSKTLILGFDFSKARLIQNHFTDQEVLYSTKFC